MRSSLGQRAVLMRLSMGAPGEHRQDAELTGEFKTSHNLGQGAGNWIKTLYPPEALAPIKKLDNEARAFHATLTLPFAAGIGILPAGLIAEHADKMRQFKGEREHLVESHFLAKYSEWVHWAREQHNGTFDASLYPGPDSLREKFYFRTEPLPVPDSEHFTGTVASLLGTDLESVNLRVRDAEIEAQRELMRRIIAPVQAMAVKLAEVPKQGKDSPVFRDSLVSNVADIVRLAPKLNLSGDPQIDAFVAECGKLTRYTPEVLRKSSATRDEAAAAAAAMVKRLSGYKL